VGEYPVEALVCDTHKLCGRATGTILIPMAATSTTTRTPTSTMTSTATFQPTVVATQIPPTPTPIMITPVPEPPLEFVPTPMPIWPVIGLLGLFLVIASASAVDPRPAALDRLGAVFQGRATRSANKLYTNNQSQTEKDM
jgi:hypothetical protein